MDSDYPAIPSTSKQTDYVPVSVMLCQIRDDLDTTKREIRVLIDKITEMNKWMSEQKRITRRLKQKYLLDKRINKKHSSRMAFLDLRSQVSKMKEEHKIRATLQVELLCPSPHTAKITKEIHKNDTCKMYLFIWFVLDFVVVVKWEV